MQVKLGIAPIAWSNDDLRELGGETPLEVFLNDAKKIGFDGVELGYKFPYDKKELKRILKDYDLELAGGWFSGNLLVQSVAQEQESLLREMERRAYCDCYQLVYAECSNTIQGKSLGLSKKPILTQDEIKEYAEKYSSLNAFVSKQGFSMGFHHHMGAIFQYANEVDLFLQYASLESGLTFDTGHFYFAGANPLEELKKHLHRVKHIHLKDVREEIKQEMLQKDSSFLESVVAGVYTTPGDGVIDFKEILDFLKTTNYEGWLVIEAEQDPKRANPYEYSKKAYALVQDLLKG